MSFGNNPLSTTIRCTAIVLALAACHASAQQRAADLNADPTPGTITADNAATVIHDLAESWRIEADGTGVHTIDVKLKIQQEAGIAPNGRVLVPYIAGRQSVELDALLVLKPDGRRVTLDAAALKDAPPEESGIFDTTTFSDVRIKQITVPALAVGDELSYRFHIKITAPDVPGEFFAVHSFTRAAVILHQSFEVNWPASMPLRIIVRPQSADESGPQAVEPGRKVRRWTHAQLRVGEAEMKALRRRVEQVMEGTADGPDVQISTFRTWNDVAAWFAKLVERAETPSDDVHAKASALTAGASTNAEKLSRLHKFVSQDIRYVSLAFGPGRYQPRAVPLVLSSAYGDCKDKHALLAALAKAVGIEVRPVLISSAQKLDEEVPSPLQFDHVVSVAGSGGQAIWMDGTADGSRPGQLLRPLRGKSAFLISSDGTGTIVQTPASLPEPQREDIEVRGVYSSDGKYRLTYRRTQTGDEELAIRSLFHDADEQARRELAESLVKKDGLTGDIKVIRVTSADLRDLTVPFWYEYEVEVSYSSPLRTKAWTFWTVAPEVAMPEVADDASEPLNLGPSVDTHISVRYELPGALVIKPPVPVSIDNDIGSFQSTYSVNGGVLTVDRRFVYKLEKVPVDAFPRYRNFRKAVDSDWRQQFAIAAFTGTTTSDGSLTVEQMIAAGEEAESRRDHMAAVKWFKQVTEQRPNHSNAWNELGWNLYRMGRTDEAIAAYDRQIEVTPYHEYAYNNRGMALWAKDEDTLAEQSFRKQIEIVPLHKWAHTNIGLLRLEQKHYAAAIESLERGVSIAPDDERALNGLGRAYLAVKRTADALTVLNHSAEAGATPENWNAIAWYLVESNTELGRAQELAEKAVSGLAAQMNATSLDGVSNDRLAQVQSIMAYWDTLGWVHFMQGHSDRAIAYVQPAWELGQDALVAQHLGQVYESIGKRDTAIHAYRQAIAAGKSAPELAVKRLQALSAKYDEASSVASLQSALTMMRTMSLPQLISGRGTAEFLLLFDGAGKILDSRFIGGDASLKDAAPTLVGMSGPAQGPRGTPATLVRRAAISCRPNAKCAAILYLPRDAHAVN